MCMEPISTALTVVALKEIVKHLTNRILDKKWDPDVELGKELLRQLSEEYAAQIYVEKYVARFLRMRTLHSAETDVLLDEIYSPLTLIVQSNKDEIVVYDGVSLSLERVMNIIGLAGQGKSTILRKLFIEEMKLGNRFPFMMELRRIGSDCSIINYFKQLLEDIGLVVAEGAAELLLQSKKVVLMLDGFDEVSSSNRERILQEIIQLKTRYNCDVIVTTRPDTEICREVNVKNLRVKNLNEKDIISILSKLDKNNEFDELPALIKSNISLKETLITPILVNLLFVCYPYMDVVPENVMDFYDKLFMTLYSRHDKIKNFNREKYSKISSVEANEIFNAFCFDSLNKGVLDFTEVKIHEHLKNAIKLKTIPESNIDNIQRDFINITCLLQADGYDRYVFLHKSIQEFHAAKFVAELPYEHKVKFYAKVLDLIDIEDKYDNLLLFLKNLDRNNFERLLVINYFNKTKLNHLETESKSQILKDIFDKTVKYKQLHLIIEKDSTSNEESYSCVGLESSLSGDILPALNFFDIGERRRNSGKVSGFIFSLLYLGVENNGEYQEFNPIEIDALREMLGDKLVAEKYQRDNLIETREVATVCLYDYLIKIGAYDYTSMLFKEEIEGYYERIYKPINSKLEQVSKVLDIDFDI